MEKEEIEMKWKFLLEMRKRSEWMKEENEKREREREVTNPQIRHQIYRVADQEEVDRN